MATLSRMDRIKQFLSDQTRLRSVLDRTGDVLLPLVAVPLALLIGAIMLLVLE
jgi:hypothetical protein